MRSQVLREVWLTIEIGRSTGHYNLFSSVKAPVQMPWTLSLKNPLIKTSRGGDDYSSLIVLSQPTSLFYPVSPKMIIVSYIFMKLMGLFFKS